MIVKRKIEKLFFSLISGAVLTLACFSFSSAELLFSTDIPVSMGSTSFEEKNIIRYNEPGFSLYNIGGVALEEGVNIDAFHFNESWYMFSVDTRTPLNGLRCRCMDLVVYEGGQYYKVFNGIAEGIPQGICIDAVTVLPDESIVFSVDVPVSLGETGYQENDLIRWGEGSFSLYFDGSANGIPEGANIDGVHVTPEGMLHFSLDIPAQLGEIEVKDSDIVEYDSVYSLVFDGVSAGLPLGADLDALTYGQIVNDGDGDGVTDDQDNCPDVYNPSQADSYPPETNGCGDACDCEGDVQSASQGEGYPDGDVDGSDAYVFKTHFGRNSGNNPCTSVDPCYRDFECDGDVDGTDAFKFKLDFGRSGCPACTFTCF